MTSATDEISEDVRDELSELRERLRSRDPAELRRLLLEVAERNGDARRQLRLRTRREDEEPEVDLEAFRSRAESIFGLVRGAFGKSDSRGDYAHETDVRSMVGEVRDYLDAGYPTVAHDMARVLLDVLAENQNMLNPHRGWSRDVIRELREILQTRESSSVDETPTDPDVDALVQMLGLEDFPGQLTLDQLVDVVIERSWEGSYYESFAINSKNYRRIPDATREWFEIMGRLFRIVVAAAESSDETGFERFRRVLTFFYDAMSSTEVVFADELGEWLLPSHAPDLMERYFKLIPDDYSPEQARDAFEDVEYRVKTKRRVAFYLEYGFCEEAVEEARRAGRNSIPEILEFIETEADPALAVSVARDIVVHRKWTNSPAEDWLRRRFDRRDSAPEMVDVLRERFESRPCKSRLEELRDEAMKFDQWESLKTDVLSLLRDASPNDYIRWLLETDRSDEAIEVWREVGEPEGLEEPIAEAAADVEPDLAVDIRVRRAHEAIAKQIRRYYRDACEELRRAREALVSAEREADWQQLISELLDEYSTYRAFQDEVAKTDLVDS